MEDVKPATLRPALDTDLANLAAELIKAYHTSLEGARIRFLWAIDRGLTFWGRIKVASEETWWLSGGMETDAGCDIVCQINETLWSKLSGNGRRFLLDHFLVQVRRKTGGQTTMATDEGERLLYEKEESTLKLNPMVCARNPKGLREIDEVKKLWQALAKPAQFQIDFEAATQAEKGEDGEEEGEEEGQQQQRRRPREVVSAPVDHYFEKRMLYDLGPVAVRYTTADLRIDSVDGVHHFPDVAASGNAGDLSTLEYLDDATSLQVVKDALEQERQEWAASAPHGIDEEDMTNQQPPAESDAHELAGVTH